MEPIVIVEGDDLVRLMEVLTEITESLDDPRHGIYRLRFAIDGGIKIKANEGVWTIDYGRVEVPRPPSKHDFDLTCKCGPNHDDCAADCQCECHEHEMRIMLDGVEVGRGIPEGQAPYVFWNRVRLTTPLIPRREVPPHVEPAWGHPDLYDLAPAYRLEPIREGQ
jgi:hypothetical protein